MYRRGMAMVSQEQVGSEASNRTERTRAPGLETGHAPAVRHAYRGEYEGAMHQASPSVPIRIVLFVLSGFIVIWLVPAASPAIPWNLALTWTTRAALCIGVVIATWDAHSAISWAVEYYRVRKEAIAIRYYDEQRSPATVDLPLAYEMQALRPLARTAMRDDSLRASERSA